MSQVTYYRTTRPLTASPNHGRTLSGEQIKTFRSEFPNLPGFSRHSLLRPQSPKVSCILDK